MNQAQREAVFDFLLLAMYADQSVKLREDERLYELIRGLGWDSVRDPEEYAQLATARVRAAADTEGAIDPFLAILSQRLGDAESKKTALSLFSKLMEVDDVAPSELEIQARARAVFGV